MSVRQSWIWITNPRALLRAVLMLDDTSHSIALGAAIGMFVGFTPTVGIQMVIVAVLAMLTAKLFRFNRVAALAMVYVSNPVTMLPMYWINYRVGTLFFPGTVTWDDFTQIMHYQTMAQWWQTTLDLLFVVGLPLIVGSLILGTIFGGITYGVVLWLVTSVRHSERLLRIRRRREKRNIAQSEGGDNSTACHESGKLTQIS